MHRGESDGVGPEEGTWQSLIKGAEAMTALTGHDVRRAFDAATRSLEKHRDAINSLNVFPVPDGDTGTNMLLTMRSAMERCPPADGATAGEVAGNLADGAFWGARGNSGVILSQFFKGFAQAIEGSQVCAADCLARAFNQATDAAYSAVGQPVEGTMLTVIRSLSQAVQDRLDGDGDVDPRSLWQTAFDAAREALALTPSQLPVLQEAGVVDAGGMGMVVILGGALCELAGQDQGQVDAAVAEGFVNPDTAHRIAAAQSYLDDSMETRWGYCTQFIIQGQGLDTDRIRREFTQISDSAVVVGNDDNVRVHIHVLDPGPALSYGTTIGQLSQIDIQNMSQQNLDFAGQRATSPATSSEAPALAVVAVAPGDGLAYLFREAGCAAVVSGGQTMNPSVTELVAAIDAVRAGDTIILPNNKNVVATAELAAATNPQLHVVPTHTVPQGVTALLAFNPGDDLETNLKSMSAALSQVVSIEVTQAVRASTVGGLAVSAGQHIGLIDGALAVAGDTPEIALRSALAHTELSPDKVVTLYLGPEDRWAEAKEVAQGLEELYPGIQVDLIYGGQPHYSYFASVE